MHIDNYHEIYSFENDNWWYKARRDLLAKILSASNKNFDFALDAGCGVGSNFEILARYSKKVIGIDISDDAIGYCTSKGYCSLNNTSLQNFRSEIKFDLIICLDVLEHINDDLNSVKSMVSYLNRGGVLILSVPAHTFLSNDNDIFSHHLRRYTLKEIFSIANACELEILKLSYWNQTMFLPVAVFALASRFKNKTVLKNNLTLIPSVFNKVLFRILKIENKIFMKHNLATGVSIFCVCQKQA